jgi:hypothetical protein
MAQSALSILMNLLVNVKTAAARRATSALASDATLKKLSKLHQAKPTDKK